jgi:hypothetical protein
MQIKESLMIINRFWTKGVHVGGPNLRAPAGSNLGS